MASGVFHQLYFHFVWTTRERLPIPTTEMIVWLRQEIERHCARRDAQILACFVMPDHVHLLVSLPPCDLPKFIGQVKGASAHEFNKEFGFHHLLKWQDGYGILSLRSADTPKVIRYIENQEQIHTQRRTNNILEIYTDAPIESPLPADGSD